MDEEPIRQFLKGEYLPKFLRDFHAQKRIFKRISANVDSRIKRDKEDKGYNPYLDGYNWCMFHVLVIDFFLWFMGMHGYTLQKTHKRIEFFDLEKTMTEWDKDQFDFWTQEMEKEKIKAAMPQDDPDWIGMQKHLATWPEKE